MFSSEDMCGTRSLNWVFNETLTLCLEFECF